MTAIQVRQALAVVVDTSPVVNFARAGALRPLAQYLGTRAIITADVFAELADWAKTYSPIASLLGQAPWSEPAELSPELTQKVVDILGFVSERGSAPYAQDLGEVTCVVLAQDLRDSGLVVPVLLLDDVAHGKNLARPRGLDVVDTPGLAIEMVLEEVITEPLGRRIWRACFSDRSKWAAFEKRLEEAGR